MLADVAVLSQGVTRAGGAPPIATHRVLTIIGGEIAFQSPEISPAGALAASASGGR